MIRYPEAVRRDVNDSESRRRCSADKARLLATWKRSSTRVLTRFTFWPPGPGERSNESSNSFDGMETALFITTGSITLIVPQEANTTK